MLGVYVRIQSSTDCHDNHGDDGHGNDVSVGDHSTRST